MNDPRESWTALDHARARLEDAAVVIGSLLIDGPDPKYGDEAELQAACVAYVEAVRESKR